MGYLLNVCGEAENNCYRRRISIRGRKKIGREKEREREREGERKSGREKESHT